MPGAIDNGRFEQNLRHSLMWVICIGTNEIQRSLIAQRGLGLAEIGDLDAGRRRRSTAPLEGMRVLDFSIMLAGPYCARLLADVGAEVIKIEPPEGDDMRLRTPLRDGHSAYFGQLNAGKRSLALDLKNAEAIKLVHRLVAETDIVVENFRPGVMDRLGLGYEALREINPRLIYCSISGYGQSGPDAERAAYAMIVHAESGFDRSLMRYAGDRDRPAAGAIFVADVLGGIFGYSAIQTALVQRARTGKGQRIDVALMDCMLNLLVYELQEAQFPIRAPRPTYGPVRARDGDLLIAPVTARNFAALCEVTGQSELADDPRFNSAAGARRELDRDDAGRRAVDRAPHRRRMHGRARSRRRPLREIPRSRRGADRPASARSAVRSRPSRMAPANSSASTRPGRCRARETSIGRDIPAIGAHRDEVLSRALGLSPEAIAALVRLGAFGSQRKSGERSRQGAGRR